MLVEETASDDIHDHLKPILRQFEPFYSKGFLLK